MREAFCKNFLAINRGPGAGRFPATENCIQDTQAPLWKVSGCED